MTEPDIKTLKAQAHHIKPVVTSGGAGLTPAVMREIDKALTAHELVKVRLAADDRDKRLGMASTVADTLACRIVQRIGHVVVFYRKKPPQSATKERDGRPESKKRPPPSKTRRAGIRNGASKKRPIRRKV